MFSGCASFPGWIDVPGGAATSRGASSAHHQLLVRAVLGPIRDQTLSFG